MQMQPAPSFFPPPAALEAAPVEDCDYALGCECADPMLQIERWQEIAGGADTH